MFVETGKKSLNHHFLKSAGDVLFEEHFTDLDYLDWFSRYEQFVK